jgi:hypothetical protein
MDNTQNYKDYSKNLDEFDLQAIREATAINNSFRMERPGRKTRLSSDPKSKRARVQLTKQ